MVTLSFMRTEIKVFNLLQHVQNFTTLQCTPLPLLKKKTSSPWPLIGNPLILLPQDLASASPQYPGFSELSIPTSPAPLEVIPPSFPLEINMLFYYKLLLAELPMLLRSPNTSIQLSPTQSPQKQSEEFSRNIHSRLWWRRKSPSSVQGIDSRGWPLLWSTESGQ